VRVNPPISKPAVRTPVAMPAPPQRVTSLPFDCNADWEECYQCLLTRWSAGKRAWCCTHARRGCPHGQPPTQPPLPPTPATSLKFDCNAGFSHWQQGWSLTKKSWCCQHAARACPPTPILMSAPSPPLPAPPPPPLPPRQLPPPKPQVSVPVLVPAPQQPVTSLPFDCNADWQECYSCLLTRWSVGKRAWCCAHARRGCPQGQPPPQPSPPPPPATSLLPS